MHRRKVKTWVKVIHMSTDTQIYHAMLIPSMSLILGKGVACVNFLAGC